MIVFFWECYNMIEVNVGHVWCMDRVGAWLGWVGVVEYSSGGPKGRPGYAKSEAPLICNVACSGRKRWIAFCVSLTSPGALLIISSFESNLTQSGYLLLPPRSAWPLAPFHKFSFEYVPLLSYYNILRKKQITTHHNTSLHNSIMIHTTAASNYTSKVFNNLTLISIRYIITQPKNIEIRSPI